MHTTSFPPPHSVFPSSLCIMSVYVLLGSNMYCSEYDQSTRRQELIEGDEFSLFWSDLQRFFSNFPTSWLHTLRIYEKKWKLEILIRRFICEATLPELLEDQLLFWWHDLCWYPLVLNLSWNFLVKYYYYYYYYYCHYYLL